MSTSKLGPFDRLLVSPSHVHPLATASTESVVSRYSPTVTTMREVIDEAGQRLSQAAPPGTRVILFGSHARGEAGRHSDLDFLVIEPSVENAASESVRLRRALGDLVLAADVIVVSEQRVDEWQDVRGSLIHAALSDGRELAA
jgi:predicted nucleotidyltransferase